MNRLALSAFAASLLVSGSAFAANDRFDGFHLGAGLGYDMSTYESSAVNSFSGEGASGEVFAGYDHVYDNNVLVGVEAFGGVSDASSSVSGATLENGKSFGASARLGYVIDSNTAIYGRLGVVHSEFTLTENGSEGTEWATGYQFGVGAERAVDDHWSLRAEVVRSTYDDVEINRSRFEPSTTTAKVGVAYTF